jgi:hypothetical protein
MPPNARAVKRAERIADIQAAARVRDELRSEAPLYRRLRDGQHQVTHRGGRFVGRSVAEAIAKARESRGCGARSDDA